VSIRLARQATAEAVGTALLVAIVVGSGIFAQRLSPNDVGLQLLENSTATALGLVALILAFGPVSGAHFNPVVTLADRVLGGIDSASAAVYIAAQIVGGCVGAIVANLMFDLDAVTWSTHRRSSSGLWLGEVVATFGLLIVILGVTRSGRAALAPFAVGGYIGAAYWFTSSTSFANPAVTIARTLSDTFAGIKPSSVPAFVVAQLIGGGAAVALAVFLHPGLAKSADNVVVPHDDEDQSRASDRVPTVLFLCVHNAGRSQMALGWFNHLAGKRAVAWSGGSEPGHEVNPSAVAAMAEVGIDISHEFPKPWTDEIVRAADVVVTMGCGDACPFFPGKRYEDWVLADPAGLGMNAVRPIRDEIRERVRQLLHELGVD
jgi:arsenate reductase